MNLAELLASKRLERRRRTSATEIENLRKLVERDLTDAALPGLSADCTFATAYNAALQLSKIVLACAGYRVSSTLPGQHQTTFEAAGLVLGPAGRPFTDYLETCRRQRNVIDYDYAEVASDSEAGFLQEKLAEHRQLVESWIAKNYPKLKQP
ncbi:MAG: hypothetical protein ABSA59_07630 [Terriglobia bacterium]